MAHITSGDGVATDAWRAHGCTESDILNLFELHIKEDIVPSAVVHPLSQKLNRRLGTVLFSLWHIQIINENDVLLPRWRTIATLLTSTHLTINDVLSLIG